MSNSFIAGFQPTKLGISMISTSTNWNWKWGKKWWNTQDVFDSSPIDSRLDFSLLILIYTFAILVLFPQWLIFHQNWFWYHIIPFWTELDFSKIAKLSKLPPVYEHRYGTVTISRSLPRKHVSARIFQAPRTGNQIVCYGKFPKFKDDLTRPGKRSQKAKLKPWPSRFLVDLPSYNMVDLSIVFWYVYQAG